jgi:hypothetical protein
MKNIFVLSLFLVFAFFFFISVEAAKSTREKSSPSTIDFLTTSFSATKAARERKIRRAVCPPTVIFTTLNASALEQMEDDDDFYFIRDEYFTTTFTDGKLGNIVLARTTTSPSSSEKHQPNKRLISCRRNNPNQIPCNLTKKASATVACWIVPTSSSSPSQASTTSKQSNSDDSNRQIKTKSSSLNWDCAVKYESNDGNVEFEEQDEFHFGEDTEVSCFDKKTMTTTTTTSSSSSSSFLSLPEIGHVKTKRPDLTWNQFEEKLFHAEKIMKDVVAENDFGKQRKFTREKTQVGETELKEGIEEEEANDEDDESTTERHLLIARSLVTAMPKRKRKYLTKETRREISKDKSMMMEKDDEEEDAEEEEDVSRRKLFPSPYHCYRWIPREIAKRQEFCQVELSLRNHDRRHVLISFAILFVLLIASLIALVCRRPSANSQRGRQHREQAVTKVLDDLEQAALAKAFAATNNSSTNSSNTKYTIQEKERRASFDEGTRITTDSYPIDEIVM